MKEKRKLYLQKRKRYLNKIFGTINKPRLSIFKSNKHIYAQIIDDTHANTLISYSSLKISNFFFLTIISKIPFFIGEKIAEKALQKGIKKVIFDRKNRPYIGRIKNLADGARSKGLIF
jgi:large subunit ribosomal protein L18